MKRIMTILSIAAGLTTLTAHARPLERPTKTISLAGVDLASGAGQLLAQRRIAAAARAVCGVGVNSDLRSMIDSRNCYRDAIQQAQTQLTRS